MVQADGLSNVRWISRNFGDCCGDICIAIPTCGVIGQHVACDINIIFVDRCAVINRNRAVVFNNDIQGRSGACTMVVGNAGRNGEVKDVFYAVIRMIHRTI